MCRTCVFFRHRTDKCIELYSRLFGGLKFVIQSVIGNVQEFWDNKSCCSFITVYHSICYDLYWKHRLEHEHKHNTSKTKVKNVTPETRHSLDRNPFCLMQISLSTKLINWNKCSTRHKTLDWAERKKIIECLFSLHDIQYPRPNSRQLRGYFCHTLMASSHQNRHRQKKIWPTTNRATPCMFTWITLLLFFPRMHESSDTALHLVMLPRQVHGVPFNSPLSSDEQCSDWMKNVSNHARNYMQNKE